MKKVKDLKEAFEEYNEQIIFKIGTVDHEKIEEYKKSFYDSLKGDN